MAENLPHHTPSPQPMAATEWKGGVAGSLGRVFAEDNLRYRTYLGQNWIEVPSLPEPFIVIDYLKRQCQFDTLTDMTAVDRPSEEKRFEIIHILYSFARNERVRVKSWVAEGRDYPSIVPIFPGADWLEREIFDMFGVRFAGHPNLKRILLPEDWAGFPLRREKSITDMDNDWVQRNLGIESGQS